MIFFVHFKLFNEFMFHEKATKILWNLQILFEII